MSPPRATGIVLAGGASSRFGSDKLAVETDGRRLLHHAIAACASVADEVVVVIGADGGVPPLPTDLRVPVRVVRDAAAGLGPLAGLAAGLAAARSPLAILVGGDQPWLRAGILDLLVAELEPAQGRPDVDVVGLADGTSLWSFPVGLRVATVRPAAEVALAGTERRLFGLFGGLRVRLVPEARWRTLDPAGDSLRDVDTPADLPPGRWRDNPRLAAVLSASSRSARRPSPRRSRVSTTVHRLTAGYAGDRVASSVTLVHDGDALIVADPGMVASMSRILEPLAALGVAPDDVTHVFLSHHHPDHTLNVALFPNAEVVDFWARYRADEWLDHDGDGYLLAPNAALWLTPGHTEEDASLIVRADDAVYALTHLWWRGDRTPLVDPLAWDQAKLEQGRERLLAGGIDIVIPGHGEPFRLR